jgi:hypothetical protein
MLPGERKTRSAPVDSVPALFKELHEKARQILRLIESFGLDELDQHLLLMGCLLALGDDRFRTSYPRLRPPALWRRFLSAVEVRIPKDSAGRTSGPEYLQSLRSLGGKVAERVRPLLQLCDGVRNLSSVDCRALPLLPESLGGKAAALLADSPEAWIARGTLQRAEKERKDPARQGRRKQRAEKEESCAKGAGAKQSEPAEGHRASSPGDTLDAACLICGAPRSEIKESSISARGTYACGAIYLAFSGPRQNPLVVRPCGSQEPRSRRRVDEPDLLGD